MESDLDINNIPDSFISNDIKRKFIDMELKSGIEILCFLTINLKEVPRILDISEDKVNSMIEGLRVYIERIIGEKALLKEISIWDTIDPTDYGLGLEENGEIGGNDDTR